MKLLMDFMILNIFLGLGWLIRQKVKVLQKIFLPSSVIGGILLLISGPQVLGIVPISDMIGKYPWFLIVIILTCLVFGSKLDFNRFRSYGINPIALQMFFISLCIMIGYGIRWFLINHVNTYFSNINDIVLGIIGAIVLWPWD